MNKSKSFKLVVKKCTYVLFLFTLCISGCASQKTSTPSRASKPNVIIIYTDDHRYTGVHALGNMQVKTPCLDQLASEGVVSHKTYLMGSFSGATCIPSRAMLLTGRHLFNLQGHGFDIPKEHKTLGETFQEAGYHSHIVGKWNQDKNSLSRSFHSGGKLMGLGIYLTDQYRMPLWDWDPTGGFLKENAYLLEFDTKKNIVKRSITPEDKRGPTGTEFLAPHISEIFANSTVDFIDNYQESKPFFLYLAFPTPHDPRQAPQVYKELYPVDDIQLTPSCMAQHPFDNGHMVLRDEELAPFPRPLETLKNELSDYYAIITHLDAQIAKVIEVLKTSGLYENTLIVFAGDSGLAVGNHGLMGKQNVYDEDGLHVPLIFSGGFLNGVKKEINALSYIHDIYPTICDLVGIQTPSTVNGKSLLGVINNEKVSVRNSTYHAYKQFQRAYRKGDYKLIEYVRAEDFSKTKGTFISGSRVTQLFNIENDPWEATDLSFLPQHKELIIKMQNEMRNAAIEYGDKKRNTVGDRFDFWDYID